MTASSQPRLPPLAEEDWDEPVRNLLRPRASASPIPNLLTTLARHPRLFPKWLTYGAALMSGELPPRDRELLILRTGWLCGSEYEFGQHSVIGAKVGLSAQEIRATTQLLETENWGVRDAALLRAVDELHDASTISAPTWEQVSSFYGDEQLIELVMVVGHYHSVAFCLNAFGVEREPGVPGFP